MYRLRLWLGMVCLAALAGLAGAADTRPRLEQLLPETTCEFIASTDLAGTMDGFGKSQFGKILGDEKLKPFFEQWKNQKDDRDPLEILGFTLEELTDMSGGEAGFAVVKMGPRQPGEVLLLDVKGKGVEMKNQLAAQARRWKSHGGTERKQQLAGISLTIREKPAQGKTPAQLSAHFVKENLLVMADNLALLQDILGRWQADGTGSLATFPVYVAILEQTRPQGKEVAQVRFFLDIFGRADLHKPSQARGTKKKDVIEQLREQGFEAVKGVGGFFTFDSPTYDVFYRLAVHAPPPYSKGMRMLRFPTGDRLLPESWVPRNLGTYFAYYWDLVNAFDTFDTVFDMLAAEGDQGTWKEVVEALRDDPDGPRVDLRKEITQHLTSRVSLFSDNVEPISKLSTRHLLAFPTRNEKIVAEAVRKFLQGDPRVNRKVFQNAHVIYEIPPREKKGNGPGKKSRQTTAAISVTRGHLFVATHLDLLEMCLRQDDDRPRLTRYEPFQQVQKELEGLGGGKAIARLFLQPAHDFHAVYELTRSRQLEGAESLYCQLALKMLKKLESEQVKVDTTRLPAFKDICHHFTSGGACSHAYAAGWQIVGFYLKKQ